MSGAEPRLEQVQRWMQSVIMHRGGVAEGVESPEAREHINLSLSELGRVILRSRALSSADRLEIYVNAYYARLMECLEEEFSVTRWTLGDDLFAAVTFGYLQSYPSRSYTLNQLGAHFPRYLAESRLHASEPPPQAGPTWGEFVIELATFERTLYEVYDGTGTEDQQGFDVAPLAAASEGDVRLIAAPCLRLLAFSHPVNDYWEGSGEGTTPEPCDPAPTWVAINRRDYVVERHALSQLEFELLREIAGGAPLSKAIPAALAAVPSAGDPLETNLAAWFSSWVARGFLVGVQPSA
ncbi:MAG: DUF2063 domain-containing protein [Planctomycetota bacterium]|nr:MAG: DUF2063 domain-containing protein [Planctomycetota bacterium]